MKIDQADKIFSLYIRKRANWTCERCGGYHENGLQNSHFVGRRNEATRFDEENCSALCGACHIYFTANPIEHVEWMKKKLGEIRFKALRLRASLYHKKDRKLELIRAKALLASLDKKP